MCEEPTPAPTADTLGPPAPPSWRAVRPTRALLARPRLLEAVNGRFERRLTLLVAGAGFGKTCLLSQALEANEGGAAGLDLFLPCRPAYRFASAFGDALRALTGAREGTRDSADAIAEAIAHRTPAAVALVLDDVQVLERGSTASHLLLRVLEALPTNGHLVLASRADPGLPLSRLLAQGHALVMGEDDLAFDDEEQQAFTALRGQPDTGLRESGGWPAVLELRASVGEEHVLEFLWDEVLARMGPERATALARLSLLEQFDDELVRKVARLEISATQLVEDLPLASADTTGAVRLHRLWRPVLARFKEAREPESLRRAARVLCERGEPLAAVDLCLQLEDDELLSAQADEIASTQALALSPDVLEALVSRLPASVLEGTAGCMLEGARLLAREPTRARALLERASEGYRERGQIAAALRALTARMRLAFWATDLAEIEALTNEAESLVQDGAPPTLVRAGRANRLLLEGRPMEALEQIAPARENEDRAFAPILQLLAGLAALDAGLPEQALQDARALIDRGERPWLVTAESIVVEAMWMLGRLDATRLDHSARAMAASGELSRQNAYLFHATLAYFNATAGRLAEGREQLDIAMGFEGQTVGPRGAIAIAGADAALHVLTGDESAAATVLRECLELHPVAARPRRQQLRILPLVYLFVEDSRALLDGLALGPVFELGRESACALVELRESGSADRAAALDWTAASSFGALLVPPLFVELAVSALAAGVEAARGAIEDSMHDPHPILRRLASQREGAVSAAAIQLLRTLPARPRHSIEIRVLGPLELLRDGVLVEDAAWRRARVRSLLQYLVDHPRCRREAAGAALWPEADEKSVTNNLRVTLSHLQHVLEPERSSGEPPWFLRMDGEWLDLGERESLVVDARGFVRLCAEAERADEKGAPAEALDRHLQAAELYRGDYLAEALHFEWGDLDRTRFQALFVRSAVRAGELLLAQGDAERAAELANRAARTEEFCEAAYRLQALALRANGDRAGARRMLEAGLRVLEQTGIQPESETRRLAASLAAGA